MGWICQRTLPYEEIFSQNNFRTPIILAGFNGADMHRGGSIQKSRYGGNRMEHLLVSKALLLCRASDYFGAHGNLSRLSEGYGFSSQAEFRHGRRDRTLQDAIGSRKLYIFTDLKKYASNGILRR